MLMATGVGEELAIAATVDHLHTLTTAATQHNAGQQCRAILASANAAWCQEAVLVEDGLVGFILGATDVAGESIPEGDDPVFWSQAGLKLMLLIGRLGHSALGGAAKDVSAGIEGVFQSGSGTLPTEGAPDQRAMPASLTFGECQFKVVKVTNNLVDVVVELKTLKEQTHRRLNPFIRVKVDTLLVNGKIVVQNSELLTLDLPPVLEAHRRKAKHIQG